MPDSHLSVSSSSGVVETKILFPLFVVIFQTLSQNIVIGVLLILVLFSTFDLHTAGATETTASIEFSIFWVLIVELALFLGVFVTTLITLVTSI